MKGIILAGGKGSRMLPITHTINKQLLPVYDKPMIYYPISSLMLAGIRDILIITGPDQIQLFKNLLKDGAHWGLKIQYAVQPKPGGIPEAFLIGQSFIGDDDVCLILGDNLLYGQELQGILTQAAHHYNHGATIFSYPVKDPERYGIVTIDRAGKVVAIHEKPIAPQSNLAVIGMYFYDARVIDIAKGLKPSARGELEITDVNQHYLAINELHVTHLSRGMAWLDTGTPDALLDASNFIQVLETRQGLKICCPEEIAWRLRYIDDAQFEQLAIQHQESHYGEYLMQLLKTRTIDQFIYTI